ncbi:hypothetical protein Tco_0767572 [Tanacetum coccineum]
MILMNQYGVIASLNTPYLVVQEIAKPVEVEREHIYSASANEIDEKKPEEKFTFTSIGETEGRNCLENVGHQGNQSINCTHKILMEDDFKSVIQPQRRVNPKVQDVVKNEIVKLLDSGPIYPISDSSWVRPVHVMPKKGGMTVVLNDDNELIPSRTEYQDESMA